MAINFISSTDINLKKIIEFNIEFARNGKNKDLKKIIDDLILQQNISAGKIYLQATTGDYSYIDTNETVARLIDKERFNLILKWDQKSLVILDDQFELLSSIGGLPSYEHSLEPKSVKFPVAIRNVYGQLIDLCILHFSEAPPFQRYFKKCILFDEVKELYSSDLALPHQLRLSSMLAEEIRMGFYPFTVRTNTGKLITYNGITQFVSSGEIKGKDILQEESFSFDNFTMVQDVPSDNITHIIAKWDNRIETLFNKYTLELKVRNEKERPTFSIKVNKTWWQRLLGL